MGKKNNYFVLRAPLVPVAAKSVFATGITTLKEKVSGSSNFYHTAHNKIKWMAAVIILPLTMCVETSMAQTTSAQSADVKNDDTSQEASAPLEIVIETPRLYDNAVGSSNAASQGVVRSEDLQYLPLLRPGDALDTVPGMVVTQHSGDGKANQYFLRGYNLDHGTDFATLIDGVPVNMPSNAHGQGYSDLNYLIPELVQRINYGKGPYFAEDGDFASAGSAKFQYRNSLASNLANLTLGSFGYRRALFAGSSSFSDGDSTLLGAVDILGENGPWAQPEGLRRFNGLLRLSDGVPAQGWSVDGVYYDASWRFTDQVPLQLIQSGQLGQFSSLDQAMVVIRGALSFRVSGTVRMIRATLRLRHTCSTTACNCGRILLSLNCVPLRATSLSRWNIVILSGGRWLRGGRKVYLGTTQPLKSGCNCAMTLSMLVCSIPRTGFPLPR